MDDLDSDFSPEGSGKPLKLAHKPTLAQSPLVRWLTYALAVWAFLVAAERMLFEYPDSYPRTLLTDRLEHDLMGLRSRCGEPLEVKETQSGGALVRCGTWWPMIDVWEMSTPRAAPGLPAGAGQAQSWRQD